MQKDEEKQLTALLVDTVAAVRVGVKRTIEKFGFAVIGEADNATQALQIFTKHRPDIVVAEIKLPGISGLALLKEVLRIEPRAIGVIMSQVATTEAVSKAYALGARGFLLKPLRANDLIATLKRAVAMDVLRELGEDPMAIKRNLDPPAANLQFTDYIERQEYLAALLDKAEGHEEKTRLTIQGFKEQSENIVYALQGLNDNHAELMTKLVDSQQTVRTIEQKLERLRSASSDIERQKEEQREETQKSGERVGVLDDTRRDLDSQLRILKDNLSACEERLTLAQERLLEAPADDRLRRKHTVSASDVLKARRRLFLLEQQRVNLDTAVETERSQQQNTDALDVFDQEGQQIETQQRDMSSQLEASYREIAIIEHERSENQRRIQELRQSEDGIRANINKIIKFNHRFAMSKEVLAEGIAATKAILERDFFKEITIMFSEIKDAMGYSDHYGPYEGRKIIEAHNGIVFPIIKEGGQWIKSDGDITIGCFPDTFSGLSSAMKIMKELDKYNAAQSDPGRRISIRICLHFGQGIIEKSASGADVYGDVVNTTARMGTFKQEQFGKIIVSKEIAQKHASQKNLIFTFDRAIEAKGKKEPLELFLLNWKNPTA